MLRLTTESTCFAVFYQPFLVKAGSVGTKPDAGSPLHHPSRFKKTKALNKAHLVQESGSRISFQTGVLSEAQDHNRQLICGLGAKQSLPTPSALLQTGSKGRKLGHYRKKEEEMKYLIKAGR